MDEQSPPAVQRRRRRPATTPEEREAQLISAAMDLAEKQIRQETASSQVITHFLKAGSMREQLEHQKMEHEIELSRVKKEAMEQANRQEELLEAAMAAFRSYQGEEEHG